VSRLAESWDRMAGDDASIRAEAKNAPGILALNVMRKDLLTRGS